MSFSPDVFRHVFIGHRVSCTFKMSVSFSRLITTFFFFFFFWKVAASDWVYLLFIIIQLRGKLTNYHKGALVPWKLSLHTCCVFIYLIFIKCQHNIAYIPRKQSYILYRIFVIVVKPHSLLPLSTITEVCLCMWISRLHLYLLVSKEKKVKSAGNKMWVCRS